VDLIVKIVRELQTRGYAVELQMIFFLLKMGAPSQGCGMSASYAMSFPHAAGGRFCMHVHNENGHPHMISLLEIALVSNEWKMSNSFVLPW
jgi:hypothetical protein